MFLFIDESGNFVPGAEQPDSWCVVASFVLPESHLRRAKEALIRLKLAHGHLANAEIKLGQIHDEVQLQRFLIALAEGQGTLYACAIDAHRNPPHVVRHHHARQVQALQEHIPLMRHAEARQGAQDRADSFARLSPQLYMQLVCQYRLLSVILRQGITFYVQRCPATLSHFRWRVDQKHEGNSIFDNSFRDLAAPMLQTMSLTEPQPMIMGADYRHFERFQCTDGPPAYLKDIYGIEVGSGFSIAQVMREDFEFVDSMASPGVQIVDLLVSSLGRCMRGRFSDNVGIAKALGRLMVQGPDGDEPIELLNLAPTSNVASTSAAYTTVQMLNLHARPMRTRFPRVRPRTELGEA